MPQSLPHLVYCASSLDGGGSERQLCNLMKGIDPSQFDASLYLLYRSGPLLAEVPDHIPVEAYWDRFQPLPRLFPGREHLRQVVDCTQYLRRVRADVVYERVLHMSLIAGPAALRAGVPRVSTLVSPPSRDLPHVENRMRWLKRWLLARSYRRADHLLAVSQATAEDAASYYQLPLEQIEILPSPIDLARIDRLRQEPPPASWPGPGLHLAIVGRLSPEKGQLDFLPAFARWKQTLSEPCYLHLVGGGDQREALQRECQAINIHEAVRFYGHLANPYALMARCDALCLPSRYEGFPNVMLEAMACGVPILASHASASMHAILAGQFEIPLADPRSPQASWDELLRWYSRHREAYRQKLPAMRAYIDRHHCLEPWLGRLQEIFMRLVAKRRERTR